MEVLQCKVRDGTHVPEVRDYWATLLNMMMYIKDP
jgi:hypothetical protein